MLHEGILPHKKEDLAINNSVSVSVPPRRTFILIKACNGIRMSV